MIKHLKLTVVGALCFVGIAAVSAHAQDTTLGALLADGYEIKAMTSSDLEPGDNVTAESVFVVVQKGTLAFGCVMRSLSESFCQQVN